MAHKAKRRGRVPIAAVAVVGALMGRRKEPPHSCPPAAHVSAPRATRRELLLWGSSRRGSVPPSSVWVGASVGRCFFTLTMARQACCWHLFCLAKIPFQGRTCQPSSECRSAETSRWRQVCKRVEGIASTTDKLFPVWPSLFSSSGVFETHDSKRFVK